MRVLVTGAGGFVGSHLTAELRRSGHHVTGVDLRDAVDLSQPGRITYTLDISEPEVVVHLAARYGRLPCERNVFETVVQNAAVTAAVAKETGGRGIRLVYASSSEIYGDGGDTPWAETSTPVLPHNMYGLSKRWGEEACRLYANKPLIARLNMLYGPGQRYGWGLAALVNMIDQASSGKPMPVHRGSERSWCYITDACRAIRMLVEYQAHGVWNVSNDTEPLPMRTIAEHVCDAVGAPHSLITDVAEKPERQTLVKRIDSGKLAALGWGPHVTLEQGIRKTVEWYKTSQS